MRLLMAAGASLLALSASSDAWGHGFPMEIGASGGRITVGDGLPLSDGYSNWVFDRGGGSGEDGFDLGLFATIPGFEWTTFPQETPLTLEVIGRPDFAQPAKPTRWLWHWNLATQEVDELSPTASIEIYENFGTATPTAMFSQLTPSDPYTPVTPVGTQHDLLTYLLNETAPSSGVYGFFARLTAPGFASSEPFLFAFAYNAGENEFAAGAKSINAAAGLAGDFDVDGDVDGGDLLRWQRSLGAIGAGPNYLAADGSLDGEVNAADLAVWREQYGRKLVYPPIPNNPASTSVPEPAGAALEGMIAFTFFTAPRASRGFRRRESLP
jgi:hypothetical protein